MNVQRLVQATHAQQRSGCDKRNTKGFKSKFINEVLCKINVKHVPFKIFSSHF